MSHATRRRADTNRRREREIRAELPEMAAILRKRAARWRFAATRSEKTGTDNLRAGGMRVVAQAFIDAADLLEQREFLITLRKRAADGRGGWASLTDAAPPE